MPVESEERLYLLYSDYQETAETRGQTGLIQLVTIATTTILTILHLESVLFTMQPATMHAKLFIVYFPALAL